MIVGVFGRPMSLGEPRLHTLAGLFHRLNDFRNVGPLWTGPTGPFFLAVSGLPKHISSLTERAQEHSFSAFSRRLDPPCRGRDELLAWDLHCEAPRVDVIRGVVELECG